MHWGTPRFIQHLWFDGKDIKAGTQHGSNIFQRGRRGSAEATGSTPAKKCSKSPARATMEGRYQHLQSIPEMLQPLLLGGFKEWRRYKRIDPPKQGWETCSRQKNAEHFSFSKQLLCRTQRLPQSSHKQETNQHQQSMKGPTCTQNLANTWKRRKQEKLANSSSSEDAYHPPDGIQPTWQG